VEALTLRKVPRPVEREIRKRASRKGISLNKAVLELLEEAVGGGRVLRKRKGRFNDLDHLAGRWSRREAKVFEGELLRHRKIDPELWS
jgi:hypothetical protein